MKAGASYYPEVIPRSDWARDLAAGREIGLSVLRCGEFAWSALSPQEGEWQVEWALEFLDLAHRSGYKVIWSMPTSAPPRYLFDRWPDLRASHGFGAAISPASGRFCRSHDAYLEFSTEVAARLARELGRKAAIIAWQVENGPGGDDDVCCCQRCLAAFRTWLQDRYESLQALNLAWATGAQQQPYTDWQQVELAGILAGFHAAMVDFRRFASDQRLRFYQGHHRALKSYSPQHVTTLLSTPGSNSLFDRWQAAPYLDAAAVSDSDLDKPLRKFELALAQGPQPGARPLWIIPRQECQRCNLYPDDLSRIEKDLRLYAEMGVDYAICWNLRQFSRGSDADRRAILRADSKSTRIAPAIARALESLADVSCAPPESRSLLIFSTQQEWAQKCSGPGGYRSELESQWYPGAHEVLGSVRVGSLSDINETHRLVIAPFCQITEPGMLDSFRRCLDAGGDVITTVDVANRDECGNLLSQAPLEAIRDWIEPLELDLLNLADDFHAESRTGSISFHGRLFWAIPQGRLKAEKMGRLGAADLSGPVALRFPVGSGRLVIVLTALDRVGVSALLSGALD